MKQWPKLIRSTRSLIKWVQSQPESDVRREILSKVPQMNMYSEIKPRIVAMPTEPEENLSALTPQISDEDLDKGIRRWDAQLNRSSTSSRLKLALEGGLAILSDCVRNICLLQKSQATSKQLCSPAQSTAFQA
ncbi:uncharacterized protein PITG_06958 [Phytophthora infestans T30-4]|uniref:Uncharacterized protein n=1 Tax=Phytophthora infestans (strain T30-4) TaxID=403677 RepID=D0N6W7_PHYIT|nr:uncharacterized protein PITG_06958 [Phytophthora infestans T30-4]EEY53316.1 hypothetical protein PITG_06958 [Phytophthora infestans T30-4]|eukprot:XP_002904934.1 hypothetical protein PITG_06958 [Phytophthora infestans T30-4]